MTSKAAESSLFPSDINWEDTSGYGDFELLHTGSYADTYRARRAGRYFLIKAVHGKDTNHLTMLRREYELSVGLEHPNIAGTFTFENSSEVGPCIVMEYVDGFLLQDYLATAPQDSSRRRLLNQLLDAVSYIHSKGIIHNDLKPENIMVSAKGGNLMLMDFGLSDDDAHYLITTPGYTARYASPELAANNGKVDRRSDIYSLGILIPLICPGHYGRIASKCRRYKPASRYASTDALIRAIHRSDRARWLIPVALTAAVAVYAALHFLIPYVSLTSKRQQYESAMSVIEKMYADSLSAHKIDGYTMPFINFAAYMDAGTDETARKDSLVRAASSRLDSIIAEELLKRHDRQLWEDADSAFNKMFEAAKIRVSKQPYQIYGQLEALAFGIDLHEKRNSVSSAFYDQSKRLEFEHHADQTYNKMIYPLFEMAKTLPDGYGVMSPEERHYLISQISSREKYKPYKPSTTSE